ncbi:MAG: T9SS type A sorting domain-containing protein [Sphingobacteriales bacterium]|nr:T9SS type A sorting domain-containing protein [Sphingobacteriales bacterium]
MYIEVKLPNTNTITLALFDIQGRKIADIVLNDQQDMGKHQYSYDMTDLPKGIYICRLQTNEYSESQKIIKLE